MSIGIVSTEEYSRDFGFESSKHWSRHPENNELYIQVQQSYANNLLKSRGHVFLNEVYEMLGFDHSKAGSIVGWMLGKGDNKIDFGATAENDGSFRLNFNVDGVIYDLIEGR